MILVAWWWTGQVGQALFEWLVDFQYFVLQMEVIETATKECLPRQFSKDTSARLEVVKQALVGARKS